MIVVDASVVLDLLLDHRSSPIQGRLVAADRVLAPHLLDAEVGQVLRRLVLAKSISRARAKEALEDFKILRIHRLPHEPLLDGAWRLMSNLSFYDALYVAAAAEFGASLLTRDARLAKAARRSCTIELM